MDTATTLTPTEVIDRVRAAQRREQAAAFEQLELAVAWALLHPCPANEVPAHWGESDLHDEGLTPLAGVGAPWVAEFAPADLGAALGISLDAARVLIGDALELTHRLPRLRDLAAAGRVPVWRARQIARLTTDLSLEAAAFADRLVAAAPEKIHQVKAERLVREARLYFDPDRATAEEEAALARRGVWLRKNTSPATSDLSLTLDTSDALLFDATVTRIASDLAELGDTDDLDVRRARAVGILADPQHALDLMSGREATPTRSGGLGDVSLYVHFTADDLVDDGEAAAGATLVERFGVATNTMIADWLARFVGVGARFTVRPVIDLAGYLTPELAVDRHDPPEAMRDLVILRDAHCVFPGCRRDSRFCDLDHITEYLPMKDSRPPGQTHPGNLAPLCRTHHRVKTHSSWHYKRLDDGSYVWTSPTGHQYAVIPLTRRPR